jgi:uncharacterized protein DUF6602
VESYLEQVLAGQDLRFQAALAHAASLYHYGTRGAQFEEDVRAIVKEFLPANYRARDVLLDADDGIKKQLDLAVYSAAVPLLLQELPIELITVAGEIKTTLSDAEDIRSTAAKLARAAAASHRRDPIPFAILAGSLGPQGHARWLAELLSSASLASQAWPLWLAAFSFDQRGPMSAIRVGQSSPIRAVTMDGDVLDGVMTIAKDQLSPSAVCYLWIWAAIYAAGAPRGMDFRYMREEVQRLCTREGGIAVLFRQDGAPSALLPRQVSLLLPGDEWDAVPAPARQQTAAAADASPSLEALAGDEQLHGSRKLMLITLGPWADHPDTWDESAWGGSATAVRRGYGYYDGMTDEELLDSCRLFWRFNPHSPTWKDIEYAVIAHDGRTRAVVQIDTLIGPFWGRHGFRGHVVTEPTLVQNLIGRAVPRRQNPITTIEL